MATTDLFHSELLGFASFSILIGRIHNLVSRVVRTVKKILLTRVSLFYNLFSVFINDFINLHSIGIKNRLLVLKIFGLVSDDDLLRHFYVIVRVVLNIMDYSTICWT